MTIPSVRRHLLGYLPINLLQAVITLISLFLFTRLLTPQEYGLYTLCFTVILWIQSLFFHCINSGVGRYVERARFGETTSDLLSTGYTLFSLLAAFMIVIATLIAPWIERPFLVIATTSALIIRSFVQLGLEIHRNARWVNRFSMLEGFQYITTLCIGLFLIITYHSSSLAPLWGLASANLMIALFDAKYFFSKIKRYFFDPILSREIILYGGPLAVAYFLSMVVAYGDRFLIALFLDEKTVGQYAVAYGLADRPLGILFAWVGMSTTPLVFAAMQREGIQGVVQVMARNIHILILLALPAAAGIAAISKPMAAVLVGEEFRKETADLLPWLAFAGVINGFMTHSIAHIFMAICCSIDLLWTFFAAAVTNVILNILLIPHFGLYGAVIATIASYSIGLGLRVWRAQQLITIPIPMVILLKSIFSCSIMIWVVREIDFSGTILGLLGSIVTGVLLYGCCIVLLNLKQIQKFGFNGLIQVHTDLSL